MNKITNRAVSVLLIAALIRNLLRYSGVQAFLSGVRPAAAGLILSAGIMMFLSILCGAASFGESFSPDPRGILIFALIAAAAFGYKKRKKKSISPVLLILCSAALGIGLYGNM